MPRGGVVKHGATVGASTGGKRTPEYSAWSAMRARCSNPADAAFARYGGRGISVCARWASFENFIADVGPRPSAKHSIDRIDNDGNYAPGNVRWATAKEQAANRRRWTHCKRGHAFTPENTRTKPNGRRECRTCMRQALKRRRDKKRTPRALLIAAAPELLSALERIVERSFGPFPTSAEAVTISKVPSTLIEEARFIIAAAKGVR